MEVTKKMEDLKARSEEIERQLEKLYRERMQINLKMAANTDFSDISNIVDRALESTPDAFPECALVACQGVEGAYSQSAANRLFNHPDIVYFNSFEAVFAAIESGLCEYGVLPIENSTAGSVNKIYDLMIDHKFYIVRSTRLKIEHYLMAAKGARKSGVREIYSHEQALNQCEDYLKDLEGIEIYPCSNTAEAARIASQDKTGKTAAICSYECAGVYGLDILDSEIQDNNNNFTRFICISKTPQIFPGADKTSLMAKISHRPGSLYEVLKIFAEKGYNLSKLESRPVPDTEFEFMFYFDFDAPIYHEEFVNAMVEMSAHCESLEYLGSYTEKI